MDEQAPPRFDPVPTRASLRRVLVAVLRTDADLITLCTDYFPEVASRFGDNMDRLVKFNLLLQEVPTNEILRILRIEHSEATKQYEHLITFGDGSDALSASLFEARGRRNRQRLIEKVRKFWIEGVLEKSLYGATLIELGKEYRPDAVSYPWAMILERPDTSPQPIPHGKKMIELFDENLGELLILGKPGSGKTTMLLDLCRDLLKRAQEDESQPIPIVLSLANWSGTRQPLHEWFISELSIRYSAPRNYLHNLLSQGHLILLLDDLDVIQQAARRDIIDSINEFQRQQTNSSVVICCRISDYAAVDRKLSVQSAISIQGLSQGAVKTYLVDHGYKDPLTRELFELLSSPLMLTIFALTALAGKSGKSFQSLENNQGQATAHESLFAAYTLRILGDRRRARQISGMRLLPRLRSIARNLLSSGQSIFYLEDLQPANCLDGPRLWLYRAVCVCCPLFTVLTKMDLLLYFITAALVVIGTLIGGIYRGTQIYGTAFSTEEISWSMLEPVFWVLVFPALALLTYLYFRRPENVRGPRIVPIEILTYDLSALRAMSLILIYSTVAIGFMHGFIKALEIYTNSYRPFFINELQKTTQPVEYIFTLLVVLVAIILILPFTVGLRFIEKDVSQNKRLANQGIMLSGVNCAKIAFFHGLAISIPFLLTFPIPPLRDYLYIIIAIIIAHGIFYVFRFGGSAFLMHFLLRFFLLFQPNFPTRIVHFLDRCTELTLLQRVGGGYLFVHRLIMEYLAALTDEDIKRLTVAAERRQ